MRTLHIALVIVAVSCLLLQAACKTLAISGAKKYRVEITNAVNQIGEDITNDGKISDAHLAKLQKVLDTYAADFSKYGTYTSSQDIIRLVGEAKQDEANAFAKYKEIQSKINYIQDMVRTEVPD
jgi:hypothetical protein